MRQDLPRKRYPFRVLKGKVTVYRSRNAKDAKYHLTPECEGLMRVSPDRIETLLFPSAQELAAIDGTRPCRKCALASMVITLCCAAKREGSSGGVRFTLTSHPAPTRFDGNPFTAEYRRASETGALRLRRLAKRLGWACAESPVGPVALGEAPPQVVEFIGRNLRLAVLPREAAEAIEAVDLFWVLASDNPPEAGGEAGFDELWRVSSAIATTSA